MSRPRVTAESVDVGRLIAATRQKRDALRRHRHQPRFAPGRSCDPLNTLRHLLVASSLPVLVGAAQAADAPPVNPLLVESTLPLHYPCFDQGSEFMG
jgi:hypothetical protein